MIGMILGKAILATTGPVSIKAATQLPRKRAFDAITPSLALGGWRSRAAGSRCQPRIEHMRRDDWNHPIQGWRGRSRMILSREAKAAAEPMAEDANITVRQPGAFASLSGFLSIVIAGLLVCGCNAGIAFAQSAWPARPITLIVPFAAGGPTDVIGRLVGERMSRTLDQQIVIENVLGAGGTTAGARLMRAAPDGYTIILGNMGTHAAAVALHPKLAYNPSRDFAPIGLVAGLPVLILARKDIPARDLGEFIAYAKEHAIGLTMAHAGVGSVSHVSCQLFNSILGISPKLMGFQGSGPAMTALVAGKVDYMCDQVVTVVPQAKAHSIRVYAVGTPERNPALPDVPTAKEAGLPQFQVSAWNALFAPKATPEPVIAKLNAALVAALDDETVRKRLFELGSDIPDRAGRSPAALAILVKSEIVKWTPVLKAAEEIN